MKQITWKACESRGKELGEADWGAAEEATVSDKERVDKLMPEKVKKRRKVQADDGVRTEPLELFLLDEQKCI